MVWVEVRGFDACVSYCQTLRVIRTNGGYKPQRLHRTQSPSGMTFESWKDIQPKVTPMTMTKAREVCETWKSQQR